VLRALAVLVLAYGCGDSGSVQADVCESRIPEDLKSLVADRFKGHRLPRALDNLQEDIDYNTQHGGDGCLGVAAADFNGDGRQDYGLLLSPPKTDQVLLVAALRSAAGWNLELLRTWTSHRNRIYVGVAAAGKYRRSESFDQPPTEPGEVEAFESNLKGLVTGRTEASGIYYFWTSKGWIHVWAID
jgi:hypothetical protein